MPKHLSQKEVQQYFELYNYTLLEQYKSLDSPLLFEFPFKINLLKLKEMSLYKAFKIEQRFKNYYSKFNKKPPIHFGGYTECFILED